MLHRVIFVLLFKMTLNEKANVTNRSTELKHSKTLGLGKGIKSAHSTKDIYENISHVVSYTVNIL